MYLSKTPQLCAPQTESLSSSRSAISVTDPATVASKREYGSGESARSTSRPSGVSSVRSGAPALIALIRRRAASGGRLPARGRAGARERSPAASGPRRGGRMPPRHPGSDLARPRSRRRAARRSRQGSGRSCPACSTSISSASTTAPTSTCCAGSPVRRLTRQSRSSRRSRRPTRSRLPRRGPDPPPGRGGGRLTPTNSMSVEAGPDGRARCWWCLGAPDQRRRPRQPGAHFSEQNRSMPVPSGSSTVA
jgi:hypothetical protein